MNLPTEIVSLPYGYMAEFGYDEKKGMTCEWLPEVPKVMERQAGTKFVKAYTKARNAFMQKVVNVTGKNTMIYDPGSGKSIVLKPEGDRQ